ncbi:beta-1,6-N-acetylglucosaminyltransferase [Phyllobacterium sp. YR531]|uniref:beta-1,6-N-acetylglucosaminyltransferase n=1 Tax=Phyllobacterium sp. YR531 TaxID=1144343 RepID=UPI0002FB64EF|nr:beta-1,6-N-acetylglucosaminyltransferase [Phyllobacterium sp. YR531]
MKIKITAIVMIHDQPVLAKQLIHTLLAEDIKVIVHLDGDSDPAVRDQLKNSFQGKIEFSPSFKCSWGTYSLVKATLEALLSIRRLDWNPDYVLLLSGSDFPIKSHHALCAFLENNHGRQFIQSKPISEKWVKGGLQEERFQYYFPFNWRSQPLLFDWAFKAQSTLAHFIGTRRIPTDIDLHIGSQWWALTWDACTAILDLVAKRPEIEKYFKLTWIPDESFFQTLIRCVVAEDEIICDTGLTYFEFDEKGRPLVFYDDHFDHLRRQPFFFARKISNHCQRLRENLHHVWQEKTTCSSTPISPNDLVVTKHYQDFLQKTKV